jgi:hypothetical protein
MISKAAKRDWMTAGEAQELKALMPLILTQEPLPKRVHNAYWQHEYAMRTHYVDQRWLLVCTGLEALQKTSSSGIGLTRQFSEKVRILGRMVGINFTPNELVDAYKLRSGLAHGQEFLSEQPAQLHPHEADLYDRLEETLRGTILRAMKDQTFRAHFRDDGTIDALFRQNVASPET